VTEHSYRTGAESEVEGIQCCSVSAVGGILQTQTNATHL